MEALAGPNGRAFWQKKDAMKGADVYLITDRNATKGRDLIKCVGDALAGGVKIVQLRDKDLPAKELLKLALKLRSITKKHKAKLLINDRVDIAKISGADGVHLGVSGFSAREARKILGARAVIGVSTHNLREAKKAQIDGADFLTFGPVYETPSKRAFGRPKGIAALNSICKKISIPIYALGGVNIDRVDEVVSAGATGVAMISATLGADSVKKSAQYFVNMTAEIKDNKHNTKKREV